MPLYQYTCRQCKQDFEKRLPMLQAGAEQSCPACGGHDTRKRIGAVAVGGTAALSRGKAAPSLPRFT